MSRYLKPIEERVTELLCDLLARGETVFRTADARDPDALGVLRSLEIVSDAGRIQSVTCLECERQHPAIVEVEEATGRSGWHCSEYGFIEAQDAEIAASRLNWDRLVETFADSIEARGRRKAALIDGLLWRVGRFEFADETVHVHLAAGGLAADELSRIATALDAESPSDEGVILCGGLQSLPGLQFRKGRRPLLLSDVLDVSANRIGLSRKATAGAAGLGAPDQERPRGGRPGSFSRAVDVIRVLESQVGWGSMTIGAKQRAISDTWSEMHPGERSPSRSTILRHMGRLGMRGET